VDTSVVPGGAKAGQPAEAAADPEPTPAPAPAAKRGAH
jgi:hypothetical protein